MQLYRSAIPTDQTNPSRKRSFLKTLLKSEFENAGLLF